jgi:hypothetical protein
MPIWPQSPACLGILSRQRSYSSLRARRPGASGSIPRPTVIATRTLEQNNSSHKL